METEIELLQLLIPMVICIIIITGIQLIKFVFWLSDYTIEQKEKEKQKLKKEIINKIKEEK